MTFIGIISDSKSFERMKEKVKQLDIETIKLIHINKKSIGNIRNIKFQSVIINSDLEEYQNEKKLIQTICKNANYIVVNTDINLKIGDKKSPKIITYGLNRKANVTISSITEANILIYLQKNIKIPGKEEVEIAEKRIKREENSKMKIYEILILYIIFLINSIPIIEQI